MSSPMVQILDFPVPQMVEQLVDVFRFFDTLCPVPEQVIEVPKFVCPPRAARTVLCAPQLAEQLVEVPTLVSYSSLTRTMEQHRPESQGARQCQLMDSGRLWGPGVCG